MTRVSISVGIHKLPLVSLFCACLLLLHVSPGQAALGDREMNFPPQAQSTRTTLTAGAARYTVRDTLLQGGTRVSEYIDNNGIVFAFTWNGPFMPDLKSLLGPHFDAYLSEARKRPKAGKSQLSINQPNLIIQSSGHMRAFDGSAWLPNRLPADFTLDMLR